MNVLYALYRQTCLLKCNSTFSYKTLGGSLFTHLSSILAKVRTVYGICQLFQALRLQFTSTPYPQLLGQTAQMEFLERKGWEKRLENHLSFVPFIIVIYCCFEKNRFPWKYQNFQIDVVMKPFIWNVGTYMSPNYVGVHKEKKIGQGL